jgi:hypothetical protein
MTPKRGRQKSPSLIPKHTKKGLDSVPLVPVPLQAALLSAVSTRFAACAIKRSDDSDPRMLQLGPQFSRTMSKLLADSCLKKPCTSFSCLKRFTTTPSAFYKLVGVGCYSLQSALSTINPKCVLIGCCSVLLYVDVCLGCSRELSISYAKHLQHFFVAQGNTHILYFLDLTLKDSIPCILLSTSLLNSFPMMLTAMASPSRTS